MVDVENASQIIGVISPTLLEKLSPLVTILKAAGIALVAYLIYLFIRGVWKWRDRGRMKRIEKQLSEIDRKLDRALGKSSKNRKKKK